MLAYQNDHIDELIINGNERTFTSITWERMGLPLRNPDEAPQLKADPKNDVNYQMGILAARIMLDGIFNENQNMVIGGNAQRASYNSFSYGQEYYRNLQSALNLQKGMNIAGNIADFISIFYDASATAKEVAGADLLAFGITFGSIAIMNTAFKMLDMESGPTGSIYDSIKYIYDNDISRAVDKNLEKASKNFDAINNSPLKYVLDNTKYKSNINNYVEEIVKITRYIRAIDEEVEQGYDLEKIKNTAISFLESIVRYQIDVSSRDEYLKYLRK